jgi:hypothetical protein
MAGLSFNSPSNIIANKTEPCYPRVSLHNASQCTLRILGHRICFIENDNFIGRTRICLPVGRDSLCTGRLTSKVFDLFAYDGDSSFIRGVQLENTVPEVIWADVYMRG